MRIISCNHCSILCDYDILKGNETHKPDLSTTFYEWVRCPNCKHPIELKEAEDTGILNKKSGYDIDDAIDDSITEYHINHH